MANHTSSFACVGKPCRYLFALVAIAVCLVSGCGNPVVSIDLLNRTGGACRSASIDLKGRTTELSANVPNGNASISGGWPYPMPATATLRWVTEDGTSYTATVNIPTPSSTRVDSLQYSFVLLPGGRANAAVFGLNDRPTDSDIGGWVKSQIDLGRDGGPEYKVAMKNTTNHAITGMDARFGAYAVNAGEYLTATDQNYSIAVGLPYPVTKSATVRWTSDDNQKYAKVVDLSALPSDLNGKCIWFILKPQGDVAVRVVTWSDLRAG